MRFCTGGGGAAVKVAAVAVVWAAVAVLRQSSRSSSDSKKTLRRSQSEVNLGQRKKRNQTKPRCPTAHAHKNGGTGAV